jgi:hypothetical protein
LLLLLHYHQSDVGFAYASAIADVDDASSYDDAYA